MALIDMGITKEQAKAVLEPNPKGKYRLRFIGFLRKDQSKPNEVAMTDKNGNKYVVAKFKPLPPAPNSNDILHNVGVASFTFGDFIEAYPESIDPRPFNEDAIMNKDCWAEVEIDTYEGRQRNVIKKLININAG